MLYYFHQLMSNCDYLFGAEQGFLSENFWWEQKSCGPDKQMMSWNFAECNYSQVIIHCVP